MTLTFAETHNMVAYLSKSDASEGFNQIIDFLNGSSIKYASTVNPNIYVSCIKQFWTTVAIKKVNDVIRLQALVDKKKVVVMEATTRDALRLDDAEGVDCLPNEEIFVELARIGYEKPSTKLTFYKAFFSSQWKFLIHTILQCMSAKRTSWNEFSSLMASAVIYLSSGDLSTHTTKYTSPALTQKVFANMRRIGKGFSKVETPLFEGMLVAQEVGEGVAEEVHDEGVPAAGVATERDVSAGHDEVPTANEEPPIPSPTPPTLLPQPSQDIPSTSQVQPTPPQSPQVQPQTPQPQPQLTQDAGILMNLLQEVMNICIALTRRVEHLELNKIAQALEITKLKRRVKKLERRNKGRIIAEMDQDADVVLEEAKEVADYAKADQDANVDESVDIQGRKVESQAEIYKIDLDHANKVLSMQEEESELAEVQEVVDVVTTAKLITKVVTAASTTISAAEVPVSAATTDAAPKLTAAPSKGQKEEDLEALWSLVKERFATTKPKNFSDDFLLITLGAIFGVDAAKEFKEKHAKCLMLLVKDLVLLSQDDAVD
nr:hypothetical protein [Tanacetum cinerariifolium]